MSFLQKIRFTLSFAATLAVLALPCQADSVAQSTRKPRPALKAHALRHPKNAAQLPRKSFALYGPPLPHERARAAWQAETLRHYCSMGKLRFINPERDGQQLFCVARDGLYLWPPETPQAVASYAYVPATEAPRPPVALASRHGGAANRAVSSATPAPLSGVTAPAAPLPDPPDAHLMEALRVLAARSAPSRPLEILSLFRPPYRTAYWRHGGPGTLHSHGMAVDISAYGGHKITQADPEACVQMTLALLRDLPPGTYRMGLPKAPDTPLIPGRLFLPPSLYNLVYSQTDATRDQRPLPSGRGKAKRSASPAPSEGLLEFAVLAAALDLQTGGLTDAWPFFPAPQPEIKDGVIAAVKPNGSQVRIVRFQNEAYAPVEALADSRLRDAIKQAARRGIKIVGLFPDGADHIHLDVKPNR